MKTKQAAINKFKKLMGSVKGIVFQYEKGHWNYCSVDSPVGQDLQLFNVVSMNCNIPVKCWEYLK